MEDVVRFLDETIHWDKIGYAISGDGNKWINKGVVLSRGNTGEWDSKAIHHPVCLKFDNKYYMYYSGCDYGITVSGI